MGHLWAIQLFKNVYTNFLELSSYVMYLTFLDFFFFLLSNLSIFTLIFDKFIGK